MTAEWLGQPVWMWVGFMGVVLALLVLDLGVLNRKDHEIGVRESLSLSAMYIAIALAFGGFVWWRLGSERGLEYLTGFAMSGCCTSSPPSWSSPGSRCSPAGTRPRRTSRTTGCSTG